MNTLPCLGLRRGCVLLFASWPLAAASHHAFPETYNTSQVVEIVGAVTDVAWRNPHVEFQVAADDGGVWNIESNGIRGLERFGLSAELIEPGTRLRVAGFPARNGDTRLYTSNLQMPDGTEHVLRPGSEPRWTEASDAAP